jgi:hypothetical protein
VVIVGLVLIGGALAMTGKPAGTGATPSPTGGVAGRLPTPAPWTPAPATNEPLPSAVFATYPPTTEPATDSAEPSIDPAATARLRAMIPTAIVGTCTDVAPYYTQATVVCDAPGTSFFYYALYADAASQQADWTLTLSTAGVPPGSGSCPDTPAENAWHFGEGPDEGRLFCATLTDSSLGKAELGWTDESSLTAVFMWGDDTKTLYDLWLTGDYHVVTP